MSTVSAKALVEIEAFYSDFGQAFVRRDIKTLGKLLHPELKVLAPDGTIGDKAAWLENVGTEFKNYEFRDANFAIISARRLSKTALAVYVSKELVSVFNGERRYDTKKIGREIVEKIDGDWSITEIDNFSLDLRIDNKPLGSRELRSVAALMQGCSNGYP